MKKVCKYLNTPISTLTKQSSRSTQIFKFTVQWYPIPILDCFNVYSLRISKYLAAFTSQSCAQFSKIALIAGKVCSELTPLDRCSALITNKTRY